MRKTLIAIFLFLGWTLHAEPLSQDPATALHDTEERHAHETSHEHKEVHDHEAHGHNEYDPARTAIHHTSDANIINLLDIVRIPLPLILYTPGQGLITFSSAKFDPGHHDNGHRAYKNYVLFEGSVYKIKDAPLGSDNVRVDGFLHREVMQNDGSEKEVIFAQIGGKEYELEAKTTWDGGLLGGGLTSFYDLSITKNVVMLFIVAFILLIIFISIAKAYERNENSPPKGMQSFFEPMIVFIRDDVAKPFIGEKYERYLVLLLSLFFFILALNLWGQVPFFGSANVTGSLTVTMALALIVFVVTNVNGNANYWKHIFWMPGVPVFIKPLLAAVEVMGLFIKPLTLMLRLAGNITAGHIAILSFIGLIFILGESGSNHVGTGMGTVLAIPLTLFMMAIELIVAFVQAYVFTILTASYIGAAIEEHH